MSSVSVLLKCVVQGILSTIAMQIEYPSNLHLICHARPSHPLYVPLNARLHGVCRLFNQSR